MESTLSKIKLNRSFFIGVRVPNTHPPNTGLDAPAQPPIYIFIKRFKITINKK